MYCFVGRIMWKLHQLCAALWVSVTIIWQPVLSVGTNKYSEVEASKYLNNLNHIMAQWSNRVVHADWNWITNMTNENAEKKVFY